MRRPPAAIAAVVLLASACGPAKHLTLDLRSVQITIPRIVTPAVELVPPSTTPPPVALPPIPRVDHVGPPSVAPTTPPTLPVNPCPTADPFAVPAVPATQTVAAPPVDATTTQLATGSVTGVVQMTTTRLPSQTSSVGQRIDTWRVVRRGPARGVTSVEVYRLVHPSSSPLATAAGIYLVALSWNDPARGKVTFNASSNGLEILSLPAQPSTNNVQYVGSDTDADTLTTLTLARNIRGHKRVDACGHLIDTITVEMTGTLTTRTMQRQVAWTQQLATSYGAVDVAETLTLTSLDAGYTWTRTLRSTTVPARLKETS